MSKTMQRELAEDLYLQLVSLQGRAGCLGWKYNPKYMSADRLIKYIHEGKVKIDGRLIREAEETPS